jgi:hypothetical protein
VGIIRQGKIVEVAETAALTDRSLVQATVHFQKPVDCHILAGLSNVKMISQDDGLSATLQVWGEMDSLIKALATYPVSSLETVRPSLEDVFLEYYKSEPDTKEVVENVH